MGKHNFESYPREDPLPNLCGHSLESRYCLDERFCDSECCTYYMFKLLEDAVDWIAGSDSESTGRDNIMHNFEMFRKDSLYADL